MVDLAMEPLLTAQYLSQVSSLSNVKSISAGTSHSCVALDNGSASVLGIKQ